MTMTQTIKDLFAWRSPILFFSGVEGGFDLGEAKYEIEEVNTITVLPDWTEIPLNSSELPGEVGTAY